MSKAKKSDVPQIQCAYDKIVQTASLIPNPRNPNIHNEEQIRRLAELIKHHGWRHPITVSNLSGFVVAGHCRLAAAKLLKLETVPVDYQDFASQAEEWAVLIADNAIQELAEIDNSLMVDLLKDLEIADYNLDLTALDTSQIGNYFDSVVTSDEKDDEVPEPPKEAITKTGDLWILGNHRLLCGDSTKEEDVKRLMNGQKADMIFIDPPYAVNYGHDQKELQKKSGGKFSKTRTISTVQGDSMTTKETSEKLWRPSFRNMYIFAKNDCSFYMTMCQGGDQMMMMMMSEHWQIKHELIWVKNAPVFSMGRLDYDYQHEPILFGWKKKHNFYSKGEFIKSVWPINKSIKSDLHPTMKPVTLIENTLLNSSLRNDLCLDLFLGSGSTFIACEKLNRKCYGMEIEPIYCDVVVKRWENFTGGKAKLTNE